MQRFVSSTGNMEVLLLHTHPIVCALAYFDPKKYTYFLAKIDLFHTFMLHNFLVQTLQCAETLLLHFFSDEKTNLKRRIA
jgi:hypothetical protein